MGKAPPLISVVIPVYKAENCLHELYCRLAASLSAISEDYEILMIEDCGGDGSWDIICELSRQNPRVHGFQFSRNFGQHYGITAGLDNARGEWVVVMDCDLQERPEDIQKLYTKAREGYDVVLALRIKRKDSWYRRLSAYLFYKFFNYLSGLNLEADAGNLSIFSRRVVEAFCSMRENFRLFNGLVGWMGFPTATIRVEHAGRYAGKSTYDFIKMIQLATDAIIAYSDKPLRITILFGLLISLIAFASGFYYLIHALIHGRSLAGWEIPIVSIYFLSGVTKV